MSCSALKRKYRDQLRHHAPTAEFVHLHGSREVIARRQASRPGHFMPASLLDSQFATLEPLAPDEHGLVVDVDQSIDAIVQAYVDQHPRPHRGAAMTGAPMSLVPLADAAPLVDPVAAGWQLVTAALLGIGADRRC